MKINFHFTTTDGAVMPAQVWTRFVTSTSGAIVGKWNERMQRAVGGSGRVRPTVTTMKSKGAWYVAGEVTDLDLRVSNLDEYRARIVVDMEGLGGAWAEKVREVLRADITNKMERFYRTKLNVVDWDIKLIGDQTQ